MITPNWIFNATVINVHDGDTLRVRVDQGFNVNGSVVDIRLKDCYAPEITGPQKPQGIVSRDYLARLLPTGTQVVVQTEMITSRAGEPEMNRSFIRYVGRVWLVFAGAQQDVSKLMVSAGMATDLPAPGPTSPQSEPASRANPA